MARSAPSRRRRPDEPTLPDRRLRRDLPHIPADGAGTIQLGIRGLRRVGQKPRQGRDVVGGSRWPHLPQHHLRRDVGALETCGQRPDRPRCETRRSRLHNAAPRRRVVGDHAGLHALRRRACARNNTTHHQGHRLPHKRVRHHHRHHRPQKPREGRRGPRRLPYPQEPGSGRRRRAVARVRGATLRSLARSASPQEPFV